MVSFGVWRRLFIVGEDEGSQVTRPGGRESLPGPGQFELGIDGNADKSHIPNLLLVTLARCFFVCCGRR